jgi:hypothetical protein
MPDTRPLKPIALIIGWPCPSPFTIGTDHRVNPTGCHGTEMRTGGSMRNDKLSLDTLVPIADADIHPRDANVANDFFRGALSLTFRLLQIREPKPFIGERAVVIEFQIEIIQRHFWKMQNEANGSMDEIPQVNWQARPRQAAFIGCPVDDIAFDAHVAAGSPMQLSVTVRT